MKRMLLGIAGLFFFAGCVKEGDNSGSAGDDSLEINLYNEIVQVPVARVNDQGFCNGDAVGIYVVNYQDGMPGKLLTEGNQADNVKFTFNEPEGRWIPAVPVYYKDKNTNVDIYGYYPYSVLSSVNEYQFEIQKDQSQDATGGKLGGYEASDFLWGKASGVRPSSSRVNIQFHHLMSGVNVFLTEGTGFAEGEFAMLEKSVLVTNTARKSIVDLSSGTVEAAGEIPSTGIVPYSRDGAFRAVVVPQTVGAAIPLFSITVDGIPYVFRKQEAFSYVSGRLHKFTIEISKKSQGGLEFELVGESITAWETDNISHDGEAREYVVIDCPEGGKLRETIEASGKDFSKIVNLKVTGKIDASDFYFMKDDMSMLQSLNLKESEIVAYEDSYENHEANAIPDAAFAYKKSLLRFVFPERVSRIGNYAFSGTNLTGSLVIPEGVLEISYEAFYSCPFNGTLTLPNSLKSIGGNAFYNCSGFIGELKIPSGVEYIGSTCFSGCSGFTGNLLLPENLESLQFWTFRWCSGLTGSIVIPEKVKSIGEYCFSGCSGLNGQLVLPEGLTEIGDYAFENCGFRGELILPDGLSVIGKSAFYSCDFSGNLVIPESVAVIKEDAFSYCQRLVGVVKLPEEIISVAANTFAQCRNLQGVILPKNIEAVGSNAFMNCFQLNSIKSLSVNPPRLAADAFDGVAKDNFTVEVPESSVADYITAPGWSEFKRFSANRDFSISRNLLRTLNASSSRQYVLRAPSGSSWKVESAPEWVTVSPAEGTGKTEVTVALSELPHGAGCRDGVVTFLLDGKDYRSSMTVEQYDYQYGDGDVLTVQSASKGAGVNLVFMGDCFDAKDIYDGKYHDGLMEAIDHFFAIEPYSTYRDYFNVYVVFGVSPDSGIGSVNTIREAKFGSSYSLAGIAPDERVCFEYACKAPIGGNVSNTLVTLILNTSEYGGITYMWGDGSAIACCPMSRDVYPYDFRGLVQHEAGGHGFGKLGDEYIYHNAFIQNCGCMCCPHVEEFNDNKSRGWYDNLSLSGNMAEVPWSHLIFDPQYSNTVDIYEGGYMHMRGVFRSETNSCMNNNIPYFSAISRESIVKRIMDYAGEAYSFEDFKSKDVILPGTAAFRTVSSPFDGYQSSKQSHPVYMGEKPVFDR